MAGQGRRLRLLMIATPVQDMEEAPSQKNHPLPRRGPTKINACRITSELLDGLDQHLVFLNILNSKVHSSPEGIQVCPSTPYMQLLIIYRPPSKPTWHAASQEFTAN